MMQIIKRVDDAYALLKKGEVIAYPTEAVYGLGCDPFNEKAVLHLLKLKQRDVAKGLILIISEWAQLWPLIADLPEEKLDAVKKTWPGAVTWVFPKSDKVPAWVSGAHETIAIRMTAHPVARALCKHGPLVSTSANIAGDEAARDIDALTRFFPAGVAGMVAGELGGNLAVSEICSVQDGTRLRGV